jgi:hypothetical protein
MALGIYFVHKGFTPEKYGEAIKQLEAGGAGAPKGRKYGACVVSVGEVRG